MQLTVQDAFALAARHEAAGRAADARRIYDDILAALPEHPGALLKIALQELSSGTHARACERLERALASAQRQALPTQEIWLGLARTHFAAGDSALAASAIEEAHTLGKRLKASGAAVEACAVLDECVQLAPDDAGLRLTFGAVLIDADRPADAERELERAIALGAREGEAWDNLGLARRLQGKDEQALSAFQRAAAAAPALTPALANLIYARYTLCAWDGLETDEQHLIATLDASTSDPRWPPWIALAMPITPAQQLAVARRWAGATLPQPSPRRAVPRRGEKLRVGYLSGNFRDHPTGRLMAGLFEHHDRNRFEITGYSYGPDGASATTARLRAAFDRWRDVRELADDAVARLIREDAIDLLVDRHGYTLGGRLGILASRPAPVQVHYMSFPGTLGYDALDHVIADAEVIPPGEEQFFHERVWRLPRCYYVNDSRRGVPPPTPRSAHGLPENALVLACLNQSYKLRRPLFATWLSVLRGRGDVVLWLLAGHPRMQANLSAEAKRGGVDPARLVFARAVPEEAHIARLACADLALDTLPYGSHTTGCDALWMGVPMLTCRGTTFAGRVGASLLKAAGLPELIADSLEEYGERLHEVVAKPARLVEYREYLERTRGTNPLFDTEGFTRDWEELLMRIYDEGSGRADKSAVKSVDRSG